MAGAAAPGKRVAKEGQRGHYDQEHQQACLLFHSLVIAAVACKDEVVIVYILTPRQLAVCAGSFGQTTQAMHHRLTHHRTLLRLEPYTAHASGGRTEETKGRL